MYAGACRSGASIAYRQLFKHILNDLLYEQRRLVDYFDKELCIFPAEDWPRFSYMRQIRGGWMRAMSRLLPRASCLLRDIGRRGPAVFKGFRLKRTRCTGSGDLPVCRALYWKHLYYAGTLGIHHKQGAIKYYDLIERCLPDGFTQETIGFRKRRTALQFFAYPPHRVRRTDVE